jgi:hypothetical protein
MKEKEKEIKRQEKLKKHLKAGMGGSAASATGISSAQARAELTTVVKDSAATGFGASIGAGGGGGLFGQVKKAQPSTTGGGKALKLGAKAAANEDAFLQQLRTEGEKIGMEKVGNVNFGFQRQKQNPNPSQESTPASAGAGTTQSGDAAAPASAKPGGPVHFKCIEKLNAVLSRGGDVNSAEVSKSSQIQLLT